MDELNKDLTNVINEKLRKSQKVSKGMNQSFMRSLTALSFLIPLIFIVFQVVNFFSSAGPEDAPSTNDSDGHEMVEKKFEFTFGERGIDTTDTKFIRKYVNEHTDGLYSGHKFVLDSNRQKFVVQATYLVKRDSRSSVVSARSGTTEESGEASSGSGSQGEAEESYLDKYSQLIIGISVFITILSVFLVFVVLRRLSNREFSPPLMQVEDGEDEYQLVFSAISSTHAAIKHQTKEVKRQARLSFNAALMLIVIGSLVMIFGVFMSFSEHVPEGVLTAGSGIISALVGRFAMSMYRESNESYLALNKKLNVVVIAQTQYTLIRTLSSKKERDEAVKALIINIQNVSFNAA